MFTPIHSLLGAYLLHLSTSRHTQLTGRPLGISGILHAAVLGDRDLWRWTFLVGLVGSAVLGKIAFPELGRVGWEVHGYGIRDGLVGDQWGRRILSGLLVGFGSKLGSGCTSGHFLCGLPRLSPRSITASLTFFLTATIVSNVFPHPGFPRHESPVGAERGGAGMMMDIAWPGKGEGWVLLGLVGGVQLGYTVFLPWIVTGLDSSSQSQSRSRSRSRIISETWKRDERIISLISGFTFGLGLLMSGMISPLKTLGFMRLPFLSSLRLSSPLDDATGTRGWEEWDPSLGMVVLAGVIPNMIYWLTRTKPRITNGLGPEIYDRSSASLIERRMKMDERRETEMDVEVDVKEYSSSKRTERRSTGQTRWTFPLGKAANRIDRDLLIGSVLFGAGWGLGGVCPGPGLVRIGLDGFGRLEGWGFLGAVLVGMYAVGWVG